MLSMKLDLTSFLNLSQTCKRLYVMIFGLINYTIMMKRNLINFLVLSGIQYMAQYN